MSSIYDWSLQAIDNAHIDEIINWAEGQPPSSVNDSARAMMQRIREYLSDQGGVVKTSFKTDETDNETVITLETKSPLTLYHDGIMLRFKAQESNIGATNIILNKLSAQPVYKVTKNGMEPLVGGEIQRGGIYEIIYHGEIAGEKLDGWCLTNPTVILPKIDVFPPGFIATFAMQSIPEGWLMCNGKEYNREDYPDLFAAIGEVWGKGDGKTTFNIPDFRGMFLRGLDSRRRVDTDRVFASEQKCSLQEHTHSGKTSMNGDHQHIYQQVISTADNGKYAWARGSSSFRNIISSSAGAHEHNVMIDSTGGDETRPVNVAIIYAIKI
ncbi:phage tail protein [Bartonella ancashensis]|uniref:Phage protein n=1 Tax=Bartonella ancashensis TaxID=1318743 RepID=A0A0M4L7C3_9HYPH|nr:phage tail protein [Bartonella ancashensis]ALE03063.1 Phage protein [Bartonella ancashensis]